MYIYEMWLHLQQLGSTVELGKIALELATFTYACSYVLETASS